jgi:phosphoribosylformylglycinamidine synthase PurS subunit
MEVRLEAPSKDAAQSAANEMCKKLLANPVIEEYRVEVGDAA